MVWATLGSGLNFPDLSHSGPLRASAFARSAACSARRSSRSLIGSALVDKAQSFFIAFPMIPSYELARQAPHTAASLHASHFRKRRGGSRTALSAAAPLRTSAARSSLTRPDHLAGGLSVELGGRGRAEIPIILRLRIRKKHLKRNCKIFNKVIEIIHNYVCIFDYGIYLIFGYSDHIAFMVSTIPMYAMVSYSKPLS